MFHTKYVPPRRARMPTWRAETAAERATMAENARRRLSTAYGQLVGIQSLMASELARYIIASYALEEALVSGAMSADLNRMELRTDW